MEVCVFAFDLLLVDGDMLVHLPLRQRRARLAQVQLSPHALPPTTFLDVIRSLNEASTGQCSLLSSSARRLRDADKFGANSNRINLLPTFSALHLTSPHLLLPHFTLPHLTSRYLTSPHSTPLHLTSPHVSSPQPLPISSFVPAAFITLQ